jgi:N-methylhydantoinase B
MGVVREYRVISDDITVSLSAERQHVPARGLDGGGAGAVGMFVLDPGTPRERRLPSAVAELALPRDAILQIHTPGGGACGAPSDVPPPKLAPGRKGRDGGSP